MFARKNAQHHQLAYVTNDIDKAIALFERDYASPGFYVFNNIQNGAGKPGDPELKIGLSHVNGVEIELLEPVGDTAPLFKNLLSGGKDLEILFHHVAIRIDGPVENWEAHIATIDTEKHKVVFEGQLGEHMRFIYTDERKNLGHYVEHVWLSPEILAQIAIARPCFPAKG